jgi:[acyl-carrier-protein] S-malonyltransferase
MSRIAVLFPGQGSQEVGMGRDLMGRDSWLDSLLDRASEQVGVDLAQLALRGPARALASTQALQPLLTALCLGLYRKLEKTGLVPLAFAGHSLGELPALAAAGFCDDQTAVDIAVIRGRLMSEQAQSRAGAMIAVSPMSWEDSEAWLKSHLSSSLAVAAVNGPTQLTFSGDLEAVDDLSARLRQTPGIQVTNLRVSGAWHSEHMRKAVEPLGQALEQATWRNATQPMVFNADGLARIEALEVPRLLSEQLVRPVRFDLVMHELMSQQITDYIEVGPGKVLRGLVRLSCSDPAVRIHNVTDTRSLERCVEALDNTG